MLPALLAIFPEAEEEIVTAASSTNTGAPKGKEAINQIPK